MRHGTWIGSVIAAIALAAGGCSGDAPTTQVLEGHLAAGSAQVVRAVSGTEVIAAAQVKSDGTWTLELPKGGTYRLEVLTASGAVRHVVAHDSAGGTTRALSFKVCQPQDPYDVGGVGNCGGGGSGGCDPMTDPSCKCDPATGNCEPPPPPPGCDPAKDPNCKCDPAGNCYPPPPPECDPATDPDCKCDPATGSCEPPPPPGCDPMKDPDCKCDPSGFCCDPAGNCGGGGGGGGGCDPATDPDCKCDPATDSCEPPPPICKDPSDPNCMPPPCDPTTDPSCKCDPATGSCGPPPPICKDPNDPSTCGDPCMIDPMSCGCPPDQEKCWPGPQPPPCDANGVCDPDGTMTPDHPPGDFGCEGS